MESKWYNQRAKYSDSEIALMIKNKMNSDKISKEEFFETYNKKFDEFKLFLTEFDYDSFIKNSLE